jgi:hypothetical protein
MTIEKIVEYVLHTPHNTNKAILRAMLRDLIISNGGCGGCDHPDCPNNPGGKPQEQTYDGGNERYSGGDINQDGVADLIYDGGMEA